MYNFVFYQVVDVMTPDPITIGPEVTIEEAESVFEKHDFNGLPVVGPDGALLGMVTKLDVLRAFNFTDRNIVPPYGQIMGQPVSVVMTECLKVVEPETPLTRVLYDLVETRLKSFPVVEAGRLVGIVAREDVLRALRLTAKGQRSSRSANHLGEAESS
ncbi:MAG: CBS domain-containing protein [Proteobacteria bacterium]|nr:CBS domain-containing protein [Pseudomonadota bacterium]